MKSDWLPDPTDPLLLKAIEHQRWLAEQLEFVTGFYDRDEQGRPT